jgi:hypothetical protein
MEEWYKVVRNLKDDSANPYLTQLFVNQVFRELSSRKIRDKTKFKNRVGAEFEQWAAGLEQEYPKELLIEILNDDEFWSKTLEVSGV